MARLRSQWWPLRWLALALTAVTLSSCSGSAPQSAQSGGGATSYPVKLTSANGVVKIPRQPQRIVSLSPTATEDLYAIGAGRQVVAVDSYSTYPAQAPRTQMSELSPNVETIASYHPDLVVIAEDNDHIVAQLEKLGIPVLFEPAAQSLAAAYTVIGQLGEATGHAAGAAPVIDEMQRRIAQIVRSMPRPRTPLRVYHELEQNYYSATSRTFIGQIYTLLGLQNIADRAHAAGAFPQLSAEYIIASNPDLIVLADTACCKQSAASVAARPGWRNISAVKHGAIVPVDEDIASHWGPRIVLFVERVTQAVKALEGRSG